MLSAKKSIKKPGLLHSKSVRSGFFNDRVTLWELFCGLFTNFNNFFAAVEAASFANTVCKNILTALGALYHTGHCQLPCAGTSLVSACFGYLSLRYCHSYTSLICAFYRTNLSL